MGSKELKFNLKDNYNLIILSISHTMTHVLQRIHPLLFPILRQEFNLTLPQLGIIAAIPPIAQSLISIPAGYISDKVGPKILITLSLLVAFGGAVMVGQSVEIIILDLSRYCV
jgi:nitrate/nitrite transporter NarK